MLREWYYKLSHDMMNPNYALFCQSSPGSETYQPNQHSGINPDHLLYFRFCGRVVAKAIFDNQLLGCHFTRAFYKQILGIPVSWRDLAAVDESMYKGLLYILQNDITDMEVGGVGVGWGGVGGLVVIHYLLSPPGRLHLLHGRGAFWGHSDD